MNYDNPASAESIEKAVATLTARNFNPIIVESKEEALQKIKELIPQEASVMNGTSRTLQEIGLIEYLKSSDHSWNNLHAAIVAETDKAKQSVLRRQSVLSDFYLGSVHAITETGEIVIASNSGSQLPHVVFTSPNIIFVVGSQKIVPTLQDAFHRLETHVVPLEDNRIKETGAPGTMHSKTVILHQENPKMGRKVYVLIVKEKLGF